MTQAEKDKLYEALDNLEERHPAFAENVYDNAYCEAIRDVKRIVASIKEVQLTGLDEVAEDYVDKTDHSGRIEDYEGNEICVWRFDSMVNCFKAGAEWMAEHGETSNGVIKFVEGCNDDDTMVKVILPDVNPKNSRPNEKVIVQIRKRRADR